MNLDGEHELLLLQKLYAVQLHLVVLLVLLEKAYRFIKLPKPGFTSLSFSLNLVAIKLLSILF